MRKINEKICACGIAAVDCDYHKPSEAARAVYDHVVFIARNVYGLEWDGEQWREIKQRKP